MAQTVKCHHDVDYVTAGETYTVQRGKRETYFRNTRRDSGTSVPNWMFDQAVKSGAFEVVT